MMQDVENIDYQAPALNESGGIDCEVNHPAYG